MSIDTTLDPAPDHSPDRSPDHSSVSAVDHHPAARPTPVVGTDTTASPADMTPGGGDAGSVWRTPLRSGLRLPAAAAALVAAAGHLPVMGAHLAEVPYIGWLFVGLGVTCVVAAVTLVLRDTWAAWTGSAAVTAAAVLGYVLSRGPGLPGMDDDIGDWTNQLGLISVGAETLVVLLAAAALRRRGTARHLRAVTVVVGTALLLNALTYLWGLVLAS